MPDASVDHDDVVPASTGSAAPLAVVSLALGALALTGGAAQASLVVTYVNQPLADGQTITFGGVTQYTFAYSDGNPAELGGVGSNLIAGTAKAQTLSAGMPFDAVAQAATVVTNTVTQVNTGYIATPESVGSTIDGSITNFVNATPSDPAVTLPPGISGNAKYYGLDLVGIVLPSSPVGVTNNYGYVEIGGTSSAPQLIGYAFQGTPNTGIVVTDLTPVPEPASLSLLAVGAAGVLATRRRRRAA